MRIVKVGVLAPTNKGVPLGVQGESCATEVEFDVRPWLREYPSGTVSAVARREGDPAPYPLTLDVADGMAVWQVSDTDTAKAGEGAVELTLTSAGTRVRSLTFKTLVTASLTDAPVDDDAWYGWLDKAVVKVDETVQAAQRKLSEVDEEWTGLKTDVNAKVDECSKAAAQAAEDAHRAKVDAQATAKALESAEGSTAKAEAAAKRAEDAAGQAEGFAAQASASEGNASAAVTDARLAAGQAEGFATEAGKSARDAMASQVSANDSAGAAADAAADAGEAAANAEKARDAAAKSAQDARDAAASVGGTINVIAPKNVGVAATSEDDGSVAVGAGSVAKKPNEFSIGNDTLTREVTHVSEPIELSSAATKGYVDTNTSNMLTGMASGKLVHVEDAWPSKPLGLTVNGAYRQDGTSSENLVLKVAGRNFLNTALLNDKSSFDTSYSVYGFYVYKLTLPVVGDYTVSVKHTNKSPLYLATATTGNPNTANKTWFSHGSAILFTKKTYTETDVIYIFFGENIDKVQQALDGVGYLQVEYGTAVNAYSPYTFASLLITLPVTHPYLAALPDSTHDEIVIDNDGNATLVAKVDKESVSPLPVPITYTLGKLDIPALPEAISNVWVEASVMPELSMTYKRDINKLEVHAVSMRSSSSITVADGTAKVNPAIFGDGLSVTDGQVSVDLDHVGEHLAGDALYYDQTDGLMLKVGQGLHIQNDELDIDQANLPLASAGVRGTVRVGSGLAIDTDGVLSATGGGGAGSGYGKLAKATLKTTERVSGIADGEDDVVTDADVPCAVGEMDGTLFLTSAPAYRVLRTTYTTGTVLHLEFEWSVDGAQLDPSMLTHAVLSLGNASTLVPMTTRSVDGKRYKAVEYTATSDIKAGMSVSLKFI